MKLDWRRAIVALAATAVLAVVVVGCGDGGEARDTPTPTGDVPATEVAGAAEEAAATATAEARAVEATTEAEALAPAQTATAEALSAGATATAQAEQQASVGSSRDSPVPLAQSLLLSTGWEITVLDFVPDATQIVLAENQFNDPPETGFRFAMVRVRATNVSADDPASAFADVTLKMVGSRNVAYDTFDPGCGVIPNELDTFTDVFRGGSIEGNQCFQAGIDETGLVLIGESGFIDTERTFFALE